MDDLVDKLDLQKFFSFPSTKVIEHKNTKFYLAKRAVIPNRHGSEGAIIARNAKPNQ